VKNPAVKKGRRMRGPRRAAARVGGLLALALALACGGAGDGAPGQGPAAAADLGLAPDFTLPDLDGQPVQLSQFRGKTVVIDFWATWCPPCIFQVPELNKFWKANRDAGDVVVLGVAVDTDGAEVVGPWVKEQGVDYRILLGTEALARQFGALGFPTLVVVTPEGRIDSLHVGLIEVAELQEILAEHRQTRG
jgi:peroxiredoxin